MSQKKGVGVPLFFITFFVFGILTAIGAGVVYLHQEFLKTWIAPALIGAPPVLGIIFFIITNSLFNARLKALKGPKESQVVAKETPKPEVQKEEKGKEEKKEEKTTQIVKEVVSKGPDPETVVVQFLGLLQKEGRLIDFLQEDLDLYDDAQIGASVREVHRGCKQVIDQVLKLAPVLDAEEGAQVEIDEVDPVRIKLVGNVKGKPPFRGVLRHCGWRCTQVKLPKWQADEKLDVLAPAEVEIQ